MGARGPKKGSPKTPGSGRKAGVPNAATLEARAVADRLVNDPEYVAELRQRMIEGTAGSMEPLLWHYRYGKPTEVVEVHQILQSVPDDVFKAEVERRLALMGGAADTANPDARGGATEH
jgi:hypothetical protein